MDDYALVLNAGSSSLKFSVYHQRDDQGWRVESRGSVESGATQRIYARDGEGQVLIDETPGSAVYDSREALEELATWLRSRYAGVNVVGVGHRVVHGGSQFSSPVIITPKVIGELRELIPLAPLHQPYNVAVIEAVAERMPNVSQVACFDTGFHACQPAVAQLIPLPREVRNGGVRRYGFHGLSYEYIATVLPHVAPELAQARVIVAHLGNGASLCAMKNCRSIDSSLGFSALDGLCMGTRPGTLDPGVVLYMFQGLGLSLKEVETILYRKSGLLGISGISSDMRDLLASKDPAAHLAVEYFVYRAAKEIGAMAAALGGLDGLVFTAGIGQNSPEIRQRISKACAWLGVQLDPAANERRDTRISSTGSKVSVWVIPTDEELMIVQHTGALLGFLQTPVKD
jgi:acetate kinase